MAVMCVEGQNFKAWDIETGELRVEFNIACFSFFFSPLQTHLTNTSLKGWRVLSRSITRWH